MATFLNYVFFFWSPDLESEIKSVGKNFTPKNNHHLKKKILVAFQIFDSRPDSGETEKLVPHHFCYRDMTIFVEKIEHF